MPPKKRAAAASANDKNQERAMKRIQTAREAAKNALTSCETVVEGLMSETATLRESLQVAESKLQESETKLQESESKLQAAGQQLQNTDIIESALNTIIDHSDMDWLKINKLNLRTAHPYGVQHKMDSMVLNLRLKWRDESEFKKKSEGKISGLEMDIEKNKSTAKTMRNELKQEREKNRLLKNERKKEVNEFEARLKSQQRDACAAMTKELKEQKSAYEKLEQELKQEKGKNHHLTEALALFRKGMNVISNAEAERTEPVVIKDEEE